jgi:hypothetical protein
VTIGSGIQVILSVFLKYAVEMASGGMIYIPSFIKIGSGIQKLIGGYTYRHTQTTR